MANSGNGGGNTSVGTVHIKVVYDLEDLGAKVSKESLGSTQQIQKEMSKMISSLNKAIDGLGRKFNAEFQKIESGMDRLARETVQAMNKMEDAMEDAGDDMKREATEAMNEIVEVVDVAGEKIKNQVNIDAKAIKQTWQNTTNSVNNSYKNTSVTVNNAGNGIAKTLGKIGKLAVAAFAVDKVVQFGKECTELGSDLAEVQNVVSTVFPTMEKKINNWAGNMVYSAGLSETMAKQYSGTFGTMAKAMGITENTSYKMSTSLTQLAGDVASFYNISQENAFEKLQGIFTGESEALKSLGVIMTQTALDQYALNNGFGRTTSEMTEQQKVMLRYQYVMHSLSSASGDFAKTQNSWANQTRILNVQFQQLKATIGQGLINALTPVLSVINALLSRLQVLAQAFANLTGKIFGVQKTANAGIVTDNTISDAVAGAENLGSGYENVGKEAEKAGKKAKKALGSLSFDQFNKLNLSDNTNSESGTSGVSGGSLGAVGGGMFAVNAGELLEATAEAGTALGWLDKLAKKFQQTFGPSIAKAFSYVEEPAEDLMDTLSRICDEGSVLFTELGKALWVEGVPVINTAIEAIGEVLGSLVGLFNMVLGGVWDNFIAPLIDDITKILVPMLASMTQTIIQLALTVWRTVVPIVESIWQDVVNPVLTAIQTAIQAVFAVLAEWWNGEGKRIFEDLQMVINTIGEIVQHIWDTILAPVLQNVIAVISDLWNNHLAPLAGKILNLVSVIIRLALRIFNEAIAPLIHWVVDLLGPQIKETVNGIIDKFGALLGSIMDILGGIIDFIAGIFSGDWEKAWDGIVGIFKGIWDGIAGVFKEPINLILGIINNMLSAIGTGINTVINGINALSIDVPEWAGGGKIGFDIPKFNVPQIPLLAEGGYVEPNTPQLAFIGDNRSQGEVVAPEDKLYSTTKKAADDANAEMISLLKELIRETKNNRPIDRPIQLNGKTITKEVNNENKKNESRKGK